MDGENRISRRRMLKRIGAGAAIAWTAPVLSSLRTPAFAQETPRCPTDCRDNPCGVNPALVCGQAATGPCLCGHTVTGQCLCFQPICLDPPVLCDAANSDCPVGFGCVNSACCGLSFCAALCTTVLDGVAQGGRRWA